MCWNKIIKFKSFLDVTIFPEEIHLYFCAALFIQMAIVYSHLCNTSASMDR